MPISLEDAYKILNEIENSSATNIEKINELRNLVDNLNTGSRNGETKTLIYSGDIIENTVVSRQVALAISKADSTIRIIDNTDAGEFL